LGDKATDNASSSSLSNWSLHNSRPVVTCQNRIVPSPWEEAKVFPSGVKASPIPLRVQYL
jgi:hypothetical protein